MLRRRLREIAPVALEPLSVIIVTLGPLVLVTTAIWLIDDLLQTSWTASFRLAARLWLLAFGTPVEVGPASLATQGLTDAYAISLVPLLLTVIIIWRVWVSGRRSSDLAPLWTTWVIYAVIAALASLGLSAIASDDSAGVSIAEGALRPFVVLTVVFIVSTLVDAPDEAPERRAVVRVWHVAVDRVSSTVASAIDAAAIRGTIRAVGVTLLTLFTAGAVATTCAVLINWMGVVAMYEGLHGSWTGVTVLTVVQLLYLPNLVIWGVGWVSGAGFSIGTGSLLSPFSAQAAPLPTIPLLAALPDGSWWHIVFLVVPLLAAVAGAWYGLVPLVTRLGAGWQRIVRIVGLALVHGGLVWAVLAVAGALASGALGPGRLQDVGVSPLRALIVGGLVAVPTALVLLWPAPVAPPASSHPEFRAHPKSEPHSESTSRPEFRAHPESQARAAGR